MAKQLMFLLICFYIGGCSAGVVPTNFREQNNDVMNMALEQSKIENEFVSDAMQTSSTKTQVNSSGLLDLNGGKNSSELDSRSLQIPTLSTTSLNASVNASTKLETAIKQISGKFDPEKDGATLNENRSTIMPRSNETESISIQSELLNYTNKELTSDINTDFISIRDKESLEEVSDETNRLLQSEWPKRNLREAGDSKVHLNERNNSLPLSPNETETNNSEFSENISDTTEEINGSSSLHVDVGNIASDIPDELEKLDSVNVSEGIFSNFGFEFLKNSEVAKNAAMAMEVFNLTDSSLTDHIIEDNEFHGFLDLMIPTLEDNLNSNSTSIPLVKLNSSNENFNISERVEDNNNILLSEDKNNTSKTTDLIEADLQGLVLNITEFENGSEILELSNFTQPIEDRNETSILNIPTIVNGTDLTESSVSELDSNVVPSCPPPGICLFWFLSQDTCAVNSHCLGSRICCRIRCSKTCVEISL